MLTARPTTVRTLTIHNVRTQLMIAERSTVGGASGRRFMRRHNEMVELSKDTLPSYVYDKVPVNFFESTEEDWKPFVNACLTKRIFTHVVR